MVSIFSFAGRIGRVHYLLGLLSAYLSQHVLLLAVFAMERSSVTRDREFFLVPLRSLTTQGDVSDLGTYLALAFLYVVAWIVAALSFRRATDAGVTEWLAVAAIVPLLQIPAILLLVVLPSRAPASTSEAGKPIVGAAGWAPAVYGLVAGMGLTLIAVGVGALIFGTYGYALFVLSPLVIGAVTAFIANRKADLGGQRTAQLVGLATALGGLALLAASLEGAICIVMAAPLGLSAALFGGLLGRSIALAGNRRRQIVPGIALLPIVFALESVLPPVAVFETQQTVTVAAPAAAVWRSVLHMDLTGEPLALPFRLGVAYPLRGEVVGEGVGALRHGEFSTGTAVERITEWMPERKLTFVVVEDVPALDEMSPYEHVHAPHAVGYFSTVSMSFELIERDEGGTAITLRSSHRFALDPVLYWLPMARWMVHENNRRVLAGVKRQAERPAATANAAASSIDVN